MIIFKSKFKGILFPLLLTSTIFNRQRAATSLQQWKMLLQIQSDQTVSQEPILETDNWSGRSFILVIIIKENKMVPFAVLFIPQHYLQKAEPAETPSLGNQRLVGRHLCSTSQSRNVGQDGQAEPGPTFLSANTESQKVTTNHKITSAHWRDEWFGVFNSLVPPKCLI